MYVLCIFCMYSILYSGLYFGECTLVCVWGVCTVLCTVVCSLNTCSCNTCSCSCDTQHVQLLTQTFVQAAYNPDIDEELPAMPLSTSRSLLVGVPVHLL